MFDMSTNRDTSKHSWGYLDLDFENLSSVSFGDTLFVFFDAMSEEAVFSN